MFGARVEEPFCGEWRSDAAFPPKCLGVVRYVSLLNAGSDQVLEILMYKESNATKRQRITVFERQHGISSMGIMNRRQSPQALKERNDRGR